MLGFSPGVITYGGKHKYFKALTLEDVRGNVHVVTALGVVPGTNIDVKSSSNSNSLAISGNDLKRILTWPSPGQLSPKINNIQITSNNLIEVPDHLPSYITSTKYMFFSCPSFNQPLDKWDTSNVDNMYGMFYGCTNFNQDLSWWCVSKIKTPPGIFDTGTPSWTKPKPVWGTCPTRK